MVPKTIARLDYEEKEACIYLQTLHECNLKGLIVPSLDRELTGEGNSVVLKHFSVLNQESKLELIVGAVQRIQQGVQLSEMDAFVLEASNATFCLVSEEDRKAIEACAENIALGPAGIYTLAGIYILKEATKRGLIEVNPKDSPRDQCYVGYRAAPLSSALFQSWV